jgi:hypothetical protein
VHLGSLNLALVFLLALAIAIAFAAATAAPIIAAPIFAVLFGGFLLWRGADRTRSRRRPDHRRVPSTEEASADPVSDSGVADVPARTRRASATTSESGGRERTT